MCIQFWLRFELQICRTRFSRNFLFLNVRVERKVRLSVRLFDFFFYVNTHPFDVKFVVFCPKFSPDSYVEFQEKIIPGQFF